MGRAEREITEGEKGLLQQVWPPEAIQPQKVELPTPKWGEVHSRCCSIRAVVETQPDMSHKPTREVRGQ